MKKFWPAPALTVLLLPLLHCHAQYSVLVLGIPETEAVEARIQFYATQFQLDTSFHITVSFLDQTPHQHKAMVTLEGEKHIHIRVSKNLRLQELEKTLAHEMVHVKQFIRGELKQWENGDVMWQGFLYQNVGRVPYLERDWEKEAFRLEERLVQSFQKQMPENLILPSKGSQ